MKTLIVTASLLAIIPTAAQAQLLGGGASGSLGGGIGSSIGSVRGDAIGSAATSIRRSGSSIRANNSAAADIASPDISAPEIPDTNAELAPIETQSFARVAQSTDLASSDLSSTATQRVAVRQIAVPAPVIQVPINNVSIRRNAFVASGVAPIGRTSVTHYVDTQYRVLERDLAGTGATIKRRGEQIVIDMPSDVTFAFDKSDIRPRFHRVLNALSGTLAQYPATYVDIIGHTDAKGSDSYNMALSQRRAHSVANYLTNRSANRSRFQIEGRGEFEPVDSNATVEGRAANRRVELILTPYSG